MLSPTGTTWGRYDRPEGWLYRVGLNWAGGVFRKRRYELLSDRAGFGSHPNAARDLRHIHICAVVGREPSAD